MYKHILITILIVGHSILAFAQYGIPDDDDDYVHHSILNQRTTKSNNIPSTVAVASTPSANIPYSVKVSSRPGAPSTVHVRIGQGASAIRSKRQYGNQLLQISSVSEPVKNTERLKFFADIPLLSGLGSWEFERPQSYENYEATYVQTAAVPQYQAQPPPMPQYDAPPAPPTTQYTTPPPPPTTQYTPPPAPPTTQYTPPPTPPTTQYTPPPPPPTTPYTPPPTPPTTQYIPAPPSPPPQYQTVQVINRYEEVPVPVVNSFTYSYAEEVPKIKNSYTYTYKGFNGKSYNYKWIADG